MSAAQYTAWVGNCCTYLGLFMVHPKVVHLKWRTEFASAGWTAKDLVLRQVVCRGGVRMVRISFIVYNLKDRTVKIAAHT